MKRRWRVALALGAIAAALVIVPVVGVESGCRAPIDGFEPRRPYRPLIDVRRPEARTWLTYPEWHIVYSAESLGRWLAAGNPPSGYGYGDDITGFWQGFCRINQVSRGQPGTGEAKVMIYTIGISFTVEMAIKAAYERTVGRLSEWLGGWRSTDDRYAAAVQQRYGAFMHEVPWYRFGFFDALKGEWHVRGNGNWLRHIERRFALSSEYLVKGGYAKLIGVADSATLAPDELTLRFVAHTTPARIAAIDARLKPVGTLPGDLTVIEAPRYAQFTDLVEKLATARVQLVEIAGNDDIFTTVLAPAAARPKGTILLDMPIERPGWRRFGVSVKVPELPAMIRATRLAGGTVEHIYDY